MSWIAVKPWLVMTLIFGVGMVAGGSLVVAFRPGASQGPPPGVQELRSHLMSHLSHRLNLTADQQAKIAPILSDAVNRIESLHHDELDRIGKIMDEANGKIAQFLTPGQQEQLKEIRTEREHDFSGHMRPWQGPGGPHGPGESGGPGQPEPHHHDFAPAP